MLVNQTLGAYYLSTLIMRTYNCEIYESYNSTTGQKLAVKIYDSRTSNPQLIQDECSIMSEVSSPYLVEALDMFDEGPFHCIVMPLYTGGDLFEYVRSNGPLEEHVAAQVVYQGLCAISYLHSVGIWHRDVKPENFFIDGDTISVPKVLLGDFGYAKRFGENEFSTEYLGTQLYAAPEILRETPYNESVDIWAMGVTMYILVAGEAPFPTDDSYSMRLSIINGNYDFDSSAFNGVSMEAKDLISRMMAYNPQDRISPEQALEHPWFKQYFSDAAVPSLKRDVAFMTGVNIPDADFDDPNLI